MNNIVQVSQSNISPFDSIRRVNNLGIEYWLARELMELLGFSSWQKFLPIVKDAIADVEIVEPSTSDNLFIQLDNKSGGRSALDYQLSRLGAYHVTLACKQRTIEVAAARRYFAIKTREAEILKANPTKDLLEAAYFAIDQIFDRTGISPQIVGSLKLNATGTIEPRLKPHLEPCRSVLAQSTAQHHQLLTATEIGKRFGISAQAVNKLLIEKGLQIANVNKKSQKDSAYIPTDRGQEFADFTLTTGANNSTTYQQLRWYESVCNFFE